MLSLLKEIESPNYIEIVITFLTLIFLIIILEIITSRNNNNQSDKVIGLSSKINITLLFLLVAFWPFVVFIGYYLNEKLNKGTSDEIFLINLHLKYRHKAILLHLLFSAMKISFLLIPIGILYLHLYYPRRYLKEIEILPERKIESLYPEITDTIEKIKNKIVKLTSFPDKNKFNIMLLFSRKEISSPFLLRIKNSGYLLVLSIFMVMKIKEKIIKEDEVSFILAHEIGHAINGDGKILTSFKFFFKKRIPEITVIIIILLHTLSMVVYTFFEWLNTPHLAIEKKLFLTGRNIYQLLTNNLLMPDQVSVVYL